MSNLLSTSPPSSESIKIETEKLADIPSGQMSLEIEETEEDIDDTQQPDMTKVSVSDEEIVQESSSPIDELLADDITTHKEDIDESEFESEFESESEEGLTPPETTEVDLLQRPNNIPFEGYHKEIMPRPNKPGRINVNIYPPIQHQNIIGTTDDDYKLKNAKDLTHYLAEIKKHNIALPSGITKANFGKFYTKASSLNEQDRKLFDAYNSKMKKEKETIYETEEEEEDEDVDEINYAKFEQGIHREILVNAHPEIKHIDFDELNALSRVVRDSEGRIIDDLHKTIPFMTKYEQTKILGIRAKQLNSGAPPFIPLTEEMIDGYSIAQYELAEKKIPFIIRRPIPNGASEYWRVQDLIILR